MRCVEYYDKCEREGYDWCEKEPETVRTITEYIKLYKQLEILGVPRDTTIRGVSETAARPLIRKRDIKVREKVMLSVSKALESGKHPKTGKFLKDRQITMKMVESLVEDAEIAVRNEKMNAELEETRAEEARTGIKNITQDEVDSILERGKEPEEEPQPTINKQGNRVYSDSEVERVKSDSSPGLVIQTIMQFEIDLYFEVMAKILCQEDIPKHRKRVKMMIDNETLLITG